MLCQRRRRCTTLNQRWGNVSYLIGCCQREWGVGCKVAACMENHLGNQGKGATQKNTRHLPNAGLMPGQGRINISYLLGYVQGGAPEGWGPRRGWGGHHHKGPSWHAALSLLAKPRPQDVTPDADSMLGRRRRSRPSIGSASAHRSALPGCRNTLQLQHLWPGNCSGVRCTLRAISPAPGHPTPTTAAAAPSPLAALLLCGRC